MNCTVSIISDKTGKLEKVMTITAETYKLCEQKVIDLNSKSKGKKYKITAINT